jgi:hypothetical protein
MGDWAKLAKKAKHSDAVMTGILVTKFKMGQINVEDLERMAADASRAERCSAAKKVLEAVKDSPVLPLQQDVLPISDPLLQKR